MEEIIIYIFGLISAEFWKLISPIIQKRFYLGEERRSKKEEECFHILGEFYSELKDISSILNAKKHEQAFYNLLKSSYLVRQKRAVLPTEAAVVWYKIQRESATA